MSVTFAPPLTENTVTVTPASPERSLTTQVEGSGTSASSADGVVAVGDRPAGRLGDHVLRRADDVRRGRRQRHHERAGQDDEADHDPQPVDAGLASLGGEARAGVCGVGIGFEHGEMRGADARRARSSRGAPSQRWTSLDRLDRRTA